MKRILFFLSLCISLLWISCTDDTTPKQWSLFSPDHSIALDIQAGRQLSYSLLLNGDSLMKSSEISMELSDSSVLCKIAPRKGILRTAIQERIASPFYRCDTFEVIYNELELKYRDYSVIFRAYNQGVAYRFLTRFNGKTEIRNETARFCFMPGDTAFLPYSTNSKKPFAMAYQNIYDRTALPEAPQQPAFLPVCIDHGNGVKINLTEADLENYPGMFVKADSLSLEGVFAPLPDSLDYYPWRKQLYVKTCGKNIAQINKGTHLYPWRVLAVSKEDTEMPVNHLVYALASPNRIGDVSWIEPGKAAWDWWNDWGLENVGFQPGINMETYRYHIDFASRFGLEYIILDEGWYDPKSGDMLTAIPAINLPELVAYGQKKNVKIILWTVFNVLDDQLEAACRKYADMGIAGFKVDFLDRDDQTAVDMVYRIAESAAKYHLILDFHGIYKPTGLNRTFPNVINYESVFGMEEVKWTSYREMPEYDVTFPYIRMMAGSVDYTPGAMKNASQDAFKPVYRKPMSMGTRCHQLATYIVYDSPFTMLCDAPTAYEKEADYTAFLATLPVETEETLILDGKMGDYIITARRNDLNWYVGGMTDWTARNIELDFSFLPEGRYYAATLYQDGPDADTQAEDYQTGQFIINCDSRLKIRMASGGGFALRLCDAEVRSVPESLGVNPFYR